MKKLWVIAMTCITTMVFAQQDQVKEQDQKQDQMKRAEDVKTDPSKVSNSKVSSGHSGLDGKSFKITFDAKPAPERKDAVSREQQVATPDNQSTVQTGKIGNEQTIAHPAPNTVGQTPAISQDNRIEPNAVTQTPVVTQDKTKVEQNNTAAELQKSQDQNSQPGTVAPVPEINNQHISAEAKPASDYQSLDGKTLVLTFNDGQLEVTGNAIKDGNVTIESCSFNKTSGTGSLCTVVASCSSPGSTERSYWSALIDGSQITGSVYFTNAGTSEEYFKFTGKKTSAPAKKSAAKETSSLK